MFRPLDPESVEYSNQEAGIKRTVQKIEDGGGYYEPDLGGEKQIKTAYLPLYYFNGYLEKNEYPHPYLLKYLSSVFQKILDGFNHKHAFGLERKPGNPPLDENSELRSHHASVGLSVYFRVHNKENRVKTHKAIKEASKKYGMSVEKVEKIYYKSKKEYEEGVRMAHNCNNSV